MEMKKFEHKYILSKEVLIYLTRTSLKRCLGDLLDPVQVDSHLCLENITRVLMILFLTFTLGCSLNGSYEKDINDLNSTNIIVRKNAVISLGKKKEKRVIPKLIELLRSDEQPKQIKLNVIKALGEIDDSRSVESLIQVLAEKDKDLKVAACEALGKIGDSRAVSSLILSLEDKDVRLVAIWALGNIGEDNALHALTSLLGNKDEFVRFNAARSLERIGSGK